MNGCGSDGGIPVPDTFPFDVDFTSACNAHDTCYGTCGKDRSECNKQFLSDMKKECRDSMTGYGRDLVMLAECDTLAYTYYIAVVGLGMGPYQGAQNEGCEWKKCK